MVTFVSLFLGLTLGVQQVELLTQPEVATVEVLLDGESLGTVAGPPWQLPCDFGPTLEPHRLEAIALDAQGRELGREEQWVNLPRQPAEVRAIFEDRGKQGENTIVRLRWETLAGPANPTVRAWFDGREIDVEDPEEVQLPTFDPAQLHFFRAELEFPGNVISNFETTLEGTFADELDTELTAVLIETKKKKLEPGDLQGRLIENGEPLDVVAVDKPPAEIVVVRDRAAERTLVQMEAQRQLVVGPMGAVSPRARLNRALSAKQIDWNLHFLWPVAQRREGTGGKFDLFPHSPELGPSDGSIFAFLTRVPFPETLQGRQRVAEALAVAGVSVAALRGRRAAVLVVGKNSADESDLDFNLVRRYLENIQVPLHVWKIGNDKSGRWGKARRIEPRSQMDLAWRTLLDDLDRQRVVWVRGRHLPQDIELTATRGVALVR